jgi:putative membrane protein
MESYMNRRNMLVGFAAASVISLPGLASAQMMDQGKTPALMGGDFATATSKLALRRARNPMVRTFAELEIAEQAAVAKAFGSRPGAAGLNKRHAAMLAKLERADAAVFDLAYINGQIGGHEELLGIHKRYAASGDDPMARGASIVGVTGIQSHLVMLKTIKSMLN